MRNRLVGLFGAILSAAGFGCAQMGYLTLEGNDYFFDSAAFASVDGRTVLALSSELKQSWELLSTTRHVWIVFPGEPVEGTCEIGKGGCSLRYARNLGLELGMLCAARSETGRGACEVPDSFGEWAESGSIAVKRFVEEDRLEGSFQATTAKRALSGEFRARFDPLAAVELSRLRAPGR
jgi:hypothetical protein